MGVASSPSASARQAGDAQGGGHQGLEGGTLGGEAELLERPLDDAQVGGADHRAVFGGEVEEGAAMQEDAPPSPAGRRLGLESELIEELHAPALRLPAGQPLEGTGTLDQR